MALAFKRGTEAAKSPSTGGFARTTYFSIKDGEEAVIRFLTDADPVELEDGTIAGGWLTVLQHQNVPTKGAPADYKGATWPSHMAAVCRKDPTFASLGYEDCFICDFMMPRDPKIKRAPRTWALAVLREEVRVDGRVQGYRNQMREVTDRNPDGTPGATRQEPAIVVVNMGEKNFFGHFSGYSSRFGTLLDRDFVVKRTGASTDTTYSIIGLEPIRTEDDRIFDLRDPEFMAKYLPKALEIGSVRAADEALEPIVTDRTSDDFYGKMFDTRVSAPTTSGSTTASPIAAQAVVVDNDAPASIAMDELRERVLGYPEGSPVSSTSPVAETGSVLALD